MKTTVVVVENIILEEEEVPKVGTIEDHSFMQICLVLDSMDCVRFHPCQLLKTSQLLELTDSKLLTILSSPLETIKVIWEGTLICSIQVVLLTVESSQKKK